MAKHSRDTTRQAERAQIKADRARSQGRLARLLARLRTAHDVTQAELAFGCGVSTSYVQRWEDPEDKCGPRLDHIERFPRAVRQGYLAAGCGEDLDVVAAHAETHGSPIAALGGLQREASEAIQSLIDGLATHDGRFTMDELARAERELTDVFTEAMRAVNWIKDERKRLRVVV